jgi:hypothetical protein
MARRKALIQEEQGVGILAEFASFEDFRNQNAGSGRHDGKEARPL